jgi:hypothetical protein
LGKPTTPKEDSRAARKAHHRLHSTLPAVFYFECCLKRPGQCFNDVHLFLGELDQGIVVGLAHEAAIRH